MPSIAVLTDSLINKIAAGEVVERPASVVKELVENSLDAQATQIDIEITSGGKKGILVRDNGVGIVAQELLLAVSRHATSKISSMDDLNDVNTLGFRGEALASIASVSKLTLTSKKKGSSMPAQEIYLEGGKVVSEGKRGHPEGTTVSVKYLFYQTPARLKFLKSPETEISHISDTVVRAALSHPNVSFKLTHNGRKIISAKGTGDLRERLRELFDSETADSSLEISGGKGGLEICGFAGNPHLSRSHSRNIYLFVNHRPVRDKVLFHAILEGYRNLLMRGRYPFIVLFLKVPSEMVDVNVHPAKSEVRFSNSSVIHNIVYEAVRNTLQKSVGKVFHRPDASAVTLMDPSGSKPSRMSDWSGFSLPARPHGVPTAPATGLVQDPANTFFDALSPDIGLVRTLYGQLEVIGQLMATYLVCQTQGKFVLVDQHAAHERIGYEKLLIAHREGKIPTQHLLIPENFDLNPSDTEILKKYLPELDILGIEIDFFGGNTFVVKSLPTFFKKVRLKDFVQDLIGDALEKGSLVSLKDKVNAVFASIACHSAIRANHSLTNEEMRALLRELDQYPFNASCPHGRPVFKEISKYELEKWFKRVV